MVVLLFTTMFITAKNSPDDINSHLKNTINLKYPSIGADKISHTTLLQWNTYILVWAFFLKEGQGG